METEYQNFSYKTGSNLPIARSSEIFKNSMAEETAPVGIDSAVKDYVDGLIAKKDEEIKALSKRITPLEFDDSVHYPRTTYSFIALNGPDYGEWTMSKKFFFLFGIIPWALQMGFIWLLLANIIANGIPDLSDNHVVIVAQFLAILVFTFNPDASVQDLVAGITYFPFENACKRWPRSLACILQSFQGLMACVGAMLLIATSGDVLTVLLNFAALNFVSALDGAAFDLVGEGTFGQALADEVTRITEHPTPSVVTAESKHMRFVVALFFILLAFCIPQIIFLNNAEAHCNLFISLGYSPEDGAHCSEYA